MKPARDSIEVGAKYRVVNESRSCREKLGKYLDKLVNIVAKTGEYFPTSCTETVSLSAQVHDECNTVYCD